MDTVNSSSSALLQKLDLTQQDLLKQSQDPNDWAVLVMICWNDKKHIGDEWLVKLD